MPVEQIQYNPDRIKAIVTLIHRRMANQIDDVSFQREMKQGGVTTAEFQFASAKATPPKPSTQPPQPVSGFNPLPAEPARSSRLNHDLLVVGDTIAQAIQKVIGGQIAFIPTQSITSYRVHLLRFQAGQESNVKAIESDGAFKNLQNMVSLPGASSIEIKPSKVIGQPGFIDVTIPREDEEFVKFTASAVPRECHNGKAPQTILGKDLYGEDVRLKEFIHTAVVGESGSGKSNWISQQVLIQSYWNSPQFMKFAMIDLAKRTFSRFENYAWLQQAPLLEPDESAFQEFTENLFEIHDRRTEKFARCGSILDWNRLHPDKPEPIIMIMVEELGRALSAFGPEAMDRMLVEFAENGRANGMYLTIGMQRPAADSKNGVINPRVFDNLQTVIAFRSGKSTAGLINYPQAQYLRGKGHGRVRLDCEWRDFQSYWMGPDNGDRIVKALDTWGRQQYPSHCYQQRQRMIPKAQADDLWEEVAAANAPAQTAKKPDPDYDRYLKYLELKGRNTPKQDIVRALFPGAPRHKAISGNTLKSYESQIIALCKKFE
jgi:hypothetical protein